MPELANSTLHFEELSLSGNQPAAQAEATRNRRRWKGDDDAAVLKSASQKPSDKGELLALEPLRIRQFLVEVKGQEGFALAQS
jgi:hypothetical protein